MDIFICLYTNNALILASPEFSTPVASILCENKLTVMISTDLQRLVTPHQQTACPKQLVPQDFNIASTTLLPFPRI